MDRQTLIDLIPAYTLGACSEEEASAIEALCERDPQARLLLAQYQRIVGGIAITTPLTAPPPHLEARLVRKLRARRTRRVLLAVSALAAVFALLAAVTFTLVRRGTVPNAETLYAEIASAQGSTRVPVTPRVAENVDGDLVYTADGSTAVLKIEGLPAIDTAEIYQIWMVDEVGPRSGGTYLLRPGVNYIQIPIEQPVDRYVRFGMSIEPQPGSPLVHSPTGPRLFDVLLRPT
jgi:anti-sigma-K factor RskA